MESHQITQLDFEAYIAEQGLHYNLYASSSKEKKRIEYSEYPKMFRVFHGKEIIYEGINIFKAVDTYNAITTKPEETVKLDN